MNKSTKSQFGGALQAALDAVIEKGASVISVAEAGSKEAFLDGWTRTLIAHARHLRASKQELHGPIVMVHIDDSGPFATSMGWKRNPMLGSSPTDKLAGILAAGTGDIGGCVHPKRFTGTTEVVEEIQNAGLGSALTVALTSVSKLVIWPRGIDDLSAPYQHELDDAPVVVDLAAIAQALDQFYEVCARQTTTWWLNAKQRVTVSSPESTVQNDLWHFLLGKYSDVARIRSEPNIGNGRADLTVIPFNVGHNSAVLELKTTRDAYTPANDPTAVPDPLKKKKLTKISLKENIAWACSGIQQTAAYRDHEKLDGAFLCVYDFCAGNKKEIDDAIQTPAITYNVIAKRYWITASHKEHREDLYPLEDPPT
ncbi:hypothetical protein EXE55_11955 [Burkholderia glumae]|uniref:hypothetical protein n=1 Tax=Burkholderia glumae TaxID=337 RepID=UPI00137459ED|nr:hypothetical protein [Burkholderia glumae]QHP91583.1 hypothetical protein EXE55_11955 [Burkholderia glumae]